MSILLKAEVCPRAQGSRAMAPALCVDMDGTLVLGDLLLESLLLLIKQRPYCIFLVPIWLLQGKAVLKAEIAARVTVNTETLPYNLELIRWLESERTVGRRLWLCTAANDSLAERVASHLKIFDGVLASDRRVNLAGKKKAARLIERFGKHGFDYCGNEWRDIAVWKFSHGAIVVCRGDRLVREVTRHVEVLRTFTRRPIVLSAVFRALRPHQWAKNVLVIVPLLAAHRIHEPEIVVAALLATVAFCFCASSVYIANDLLDLEADRAHVRKSKRPFAAGDLSPSAGLLMAPVLLGLAAAIALFLPAEFQIALATYYALTLVYSFALKALALVDVMTLAGLYTMRIVAGTMAIGMSMSPWLFWFSMFLFLSLAFVKRFAELDELNRHHRLRPAGRDYAVEDLPVLQSLGSAAGYLSVVVLALYINSPDIYALYSRPTVMWLLCVLMLFWISHVWVKAQRGGMYDDPVVFALKDRTSQVVGILGAITILLAI